MKYKRYIMTSWNDATTKDLVLLWNRQVFRNSAASLDPEFQLPSDGQSGNAFANNDEDDIETMRRAAEEERRSSRQGSSQSRPGSAIRKSFLSIFN